MIEIILGLCINLLHSKSLKSLLHVKLNHCDNRVVQCVIYYFNTCFFVPFSEGRPSRSDLSILVAHNDDPTGKIRFISGVGTNHPSLQGIIIVQLLMQLNIQERK